MALNPPLPICWASVFFKIESGVIPFDDSTFDCIVNNQVFEHVEDIDAVLSEVRRVLKPGGILLSLFPSEDVIREGHCGFAISRFAAYPRFGYYWLLAARTLGLGYHKKIKSRGQWAKDTQHWLKNCAISPQEK